jgi:hypothetical protein
MAVGLARLEAQGQSLGKVSPQRFKFMIGQAVGQFYLANRWSMAPPPQRPAGGGDGCLMSYQATGLVKTLVRPHGEFGARREPKSFAIGPLDLIFRKASEFHDR